MENRKIITPGKWYAEFDEDGNRTKSSFNDTLCRMLGYGSEKELIDARGNGQTGVHPDDAARLFAHYKDCISKHPEGMDFDIEYRVASAGGYRWCHDYAHITRRGDGSARCADGIVFDIQDIVDKEAARKELAETNSRLFALEDNFESMYDVELESGHYLSFVKGEFYQNTVIDKLVEPTDYFEDLKDNIDAVIYAEDRDGLYNTLTRESIRRELSDAEHFDYYYRIITENGPIWFKIRIVYKDAEKKNVIIGVFNASEDVAAKQIAEQREQMQQQLGIIGELADEYTALYHVNLRTGNYIPYHLTEKTENIRAYIEKFPKFKDLAKAFATSDLVHPDSREDLLAFYPSEEDVRRMMKDKKRASVLFLRNYGGEYLWTEASIIRCASEDGKVRDVLVGFIEKDQETRERNERFRNAEEVNKLVDSIASKYSVAFTVNMATKAFRLLKVDEDIRHQFESFTNTEEVKASLYNILHENDRARMMNELSYATIREKLKNRKTYTVEYRTAINDVTKWHEMNVTLIDRDEIAMGFMEKDIEITKRRLEDMRYDEYLALFIVDVDTGTIKPLKTSRYFVTVGLGKAAPYEESIRKFASTYEGPARDFFMEMSDIEFLKNEFAEDNKRTFSYRSAKIGNEKWIDVTSYVILRHDDGTPAMITLGFSVVDALATSRKELLSRLTENMQMIGGLASGYDALYYINIDEGINTVYAQKAEKYPGLQESYAKEHDIYKLIRSYGQSEHVHADDRAIFADFSADTIREKLKRTKKYSMRFRVLTDSGYRWDEMDVIKYEDADEQANAVAVGFADRDSEIRSEQATNDSFEVLGRELSPEESINRILSIAAEFYGAERCYVFEYFNSIGIINNTYEWCAPGIEPMIDKLQRVPAEAIEGWNREFRRQGAFFMDALDSEHNTEETVAILEMQGIDSLVAAPLLNGDEIVGFIGVDNPSKAKTDINILMKAAAVVYSEILKRKENDEEHITLGKLTDAFISVYYADLSKDYMRTWKIADEYKEAYGSVQHYSESMGGYVREYIAERDRERCIRKTSPEYILEQFKEKDKFSVDFTDIMLGYERNMVFDFIKVSEDGNQLVICSRDVTDSLAIQKKQQKLLQDALDTADAANKSKTNFLFNMSHDIRTPMNAITGFTNMAVKHIDDKAKVLDCLGKTQKAGMMLLSLINSVLEVSRIESGHASLEEQPGDVMYSFVNIDSTMHEMAETKDIDLTFEFGEIQDRYVYVDFSRCMRVFVNVISNAIKYTKEGGYVRVRCEQTGKAENGYARYKYTVEDNGIGMSEEFQKHVFDQFARENTATVSGIQGTGLGMAVCKSFVDLMGGTISVNSRQGKGSTFTIILPFRLQHGQDYTDPNSGEIISPDYVVKPAEQVDFRGKNVLLVEDNELNREIAIEILEEEGILVEDADDGTTAVEMMKEKGPDYYDFILMDIQMPKMNGYEATREIRAMYPDRHIPIVALSANAFAEDKAASLAAGMDDHVAKPINIAELFQTLAKCIR